MFRLGADRLTAGVAYVLVGLLVGGAGPTHAQVDPGPLPTPPLPPVADASPALAPPTRAIDAPERSVTSLAVTAAAPAAVPLPRVTGPLATSATSYPFNAADHSTVPVDLASYGYSEQEFVVSGTANVYGWQGSSLAVGVAAAGPYATRILVRKPTIPARFSGTVIVEVLNPSYGFDLDFVWAATHEYLRFHDAAARGDAWVGLTVHPRSIAALKRFDAARYSSLSMASPLPSSQRCTDLPAEYSPASEQGLEWDIISQVGRLVRAGGGAGPLAGLPVEQVYAVGYSRGANDLVTYANALGKVASLADGGPIFDGYLLAAAVGGPTTISQCASWYPPGDPHSVVQPNRVPIVRVNTQSDFGWWFGPPGRGISAGSTLNRRPDRDVAGDQFRLYEIPGASHAWAYPTQFFPSAASLARIGAGAVRYACGEPRVNDFPLEFFLRGALANLDRWARTGTPPVRGERIALNNPGTYAESTSLDQWGNARLGVRSPYVDVPRATFVPFSTGAGCGAWGHMQPFTPAFLDGLYPGDSYRRQVTAASLRLLAAGWITEADARQMLALGAQMNR